MITLLIKKQIFKSVVSNWRCCMAIREKGKLHDFGMIFKPNFKCLKNKKINLLPVILKLDTFTLSE